MNWQRKTEGRSKRAWHEATWRSLVAVVESDGHWKVYLNVHSSILVAGSQETGVLTAKRTAEKFIQALSEWAVCRLTNP